MAGVIESGGAEGARRGPPACRGTDISIRGNALYKTSQRKRIAIVLGDVSGKAAPAALYAALVSGINHGTLNATDHHTEFLDQMDQRWNLPTNGFADWCHNVTVSTTDLKAWLRDRDFFPEFFFS